MRRCTRLCLTLPLAAIAWSWTASFAFAREWIRVDTPNFVVFGEPSEGRLREIAEEFERFREGLARVVPGAAQREPVPTIVVVFSSQRTFEPYRPRYNGKPVSLSGLFVSSTDQNIVALALDERGQALRVIFHEYAHIVIASIAREIPTWLSEGLAEYYSTFALQENGRAAIVGLAPVEHVIRRTQRHHPVRRRASTHRAALEDRHRRVDGRAHRLVGEEPWHQRAFGFGEIGRMQVIAFLEDHDLAPRFGKSRCSDCATCSTSNDNHGSAQAAVAFE